MNQTEVEEILIAMLKELQAGAGGPVDEVTPATIPLKDLGFFDSLLALETTIAIEGRFGASFNVDSLFTNKENAEPLSVVQIAARVVESCGGGAA